MSKCMEWRPVSHLFKFWTLATWDDGIEDGDGISDWWIAIEHMAAPLGDDLRLCRLVAVEDAPGVEMSAEVRAAIQTLVITAAGGHRPPYEEPSEFYIVQTWLDSLKKGGDDGDTDS